MYFQLKLDIFPPANFKDHLVGEEIVADYLLYWLNKEEEFGYVSALGLPAPTDVINDLLMHICIKKNLSHRIRHVDGKCLIVIALFADVFLITISSQDPTKSFPTLGALRICSYNLSDNYSSVPYC